MHLSNKVKSYDQELINYLCFLQDEVQLLNKNPHNKLKLMLISQPQDLMHYVLRGCQLEVN